MSEPAVPSRVHELWGPWMKMALLTAKASPDPATQNGAVLLVTDGEFVRSSNEFPFGVSYLAERWERPTKYSYVEHAERNTYYKAASLGLRTQGSTLVCPWAACHDCARAIIQSGSIRLVRLQLSESCTTNVRWQESMYHADTMMIEAGIEIVELDLRFSITLRRDGEMVEF